MYQIQENLFGMDLVAAMMERKQNISVENDIKPILEKYVDLNRTYDEPIKNEETGEITFPAQYYTLKGNPFRLDPVTIISSGRTSIEGIEVGDYIEYVPDVSSFTVPAGSADGHGSRVRCNADFYNRK